MNNGITAAAGGIMGAIGAALAYLFGPWDAMLSVLLAVVAMDYVTGVACAAIARELDSAVGFKGLARKVFIFVLVALSAMLDQLVPATNGAVRGAVCMFYIANEGISILENAGRMGLPLPAQLKAALARLKDKGGEER